MHEAALRRLLDALRSGDVDVDAAMAQLRRLPFADLGFARVDHHRQLRQGMPEAVYGPGKTPQQCAAIVAELLQHNLAGASSPHEGGPVLLTRADAAQVDAAMAANPGGAAFGPDEGPGLSTVVWRSNPQRRSERIVVVTAGTADLPVAEECVGTLVAHGFEPVLIADVGVAGLHRVLDCADEVAAADAVVVLAGMEGALASVVGGLTAAPVVAVPTSVGYGAGFEGVTALLGMLASCASGVTVVGIDNGFGAACALVRMLSARAASEARRTSGRVAGADSRG